jgi:hypothetical protein
VVVDPVQQRASKAPLGHEEPVPRGDTPAAQRPQETDVRVGHPRGEGHEDEQRPTHPHLFRYIMSLSAGQEGVYITQPILTNIWFSGFLLLLKTDSGRSNVVWTRVPRTTVSPYSSRSLCW